MDTRIFVLLIQVFTIYGYGSFEEWKNQYFQRCDKMSELYKELIDVMENPNALPHIGGNKPIVDTADVAESSKHHGNAMNADPATCSHHPNGFNSTVLETLVTRMEQLMTIRSGISDEKSARVKNTQSITRIESIVEDKLDVLEDEVSLMSKRLTDASGDIKGDIGGLKDDTAILSKRLTEVSDRVGNIVGHEAKVEYELEGLNQDIVIINKRLTEISDTINTNLQQDKIMMDQTLATLLRNLDILMKRNNVNVALMKPASQSSIYANTVIASRAVDGNRNGNWGGNSCSCTNEEVNPWWKVDLLGQYYINRVVIQNRLDCCGARLRDLTLTVSNTTDGGVVCSHFKGPSRNGASETIWCDPPVIGQFLTIQIAGSGAAFLTLCEVEVF